MSVAGSEEVRAERALGTLPDPRPRRSWPAVAGLLLVVLAFSVVQPGTLVLLPLSLLLLALPPRRPGLVVLALAVLALLFMGQGDDGRWFVERGWGLVLSAWFLVVLALWPRGSFFPRAFIAVLASTGSAALVLWMSKGGWIRLDWTMGREFRQGASRMAALWTSTSGGASWVKPLSDALMRTAQLEALLYPALLGLASLAALALAWWGYRRLAAQDRDPLSPFRDFRFRDELVWLFVVGGILVALPLGEAATRTGSNVLLFMGALYALRGAAVLVALLGSPGLAGTLLAAAVILFLYPLVMAATLLVGLTDTWLDLRARRRAAARPGS